MRTLQNVSDKTTCWGIICIYIQNGTWILTLLYRAPTNYGIRLLKRVKEWMGPCNKRMTLPKRYGRVCVCLCTHRKWFKSPPKKWWKIAAWRCTLCLIDSIYVQCAHSTHNDAYMHARLFVFVRWYINFQFQIDLKMKQPVSSYDILSVFGCFLFVCKDKAVTSKMCSFCVEMFRLRFETETVWCHTVVTACRRTNTKIYIIHTHVRVCVDETASSASWNLDIWVNLLTKSSCLFVLFFSSLFSVASPFEILFLLLCAGWTASVFYGILMSSFAQILITFAAPILTE